MQCNPDGPPALAMARSTQPALIVSGNVKVNWYVAVQLPSIEGELILCALQDNKSPQPFSCVFKDAPSSVTQLFVTIVTSYHNGIISPSVTTKQAASGVIGTGVQSGSVEQG